MEGINWSLLFDWYETHKRAIPWRSNPKIFWVWLGEIMSQQTRLSVVIPKFTVFIQHIPTIESCATAPTAHLEALWSGLGYYNRVRLLQKACQTIVQSPAVPSTYATWLQVPGCGPYTAGMIASLCFQENVPAIDGNVLRVFARLYGWTQDSKSPVLHKQIEHVVMGMTPSSCGVRDFGSRNQAIIEFGAMFCTKANPQCSVCFLNSYCQAYQTQQVSQIPKVMPKIYTKLTVALSIYVCHTEQGVWYGVIKRPADSLLLKNHVGFATSYESLGDRTPNYAFKHSIMSYKLDCLVYIITVADMDATQIDIGVSFMWYQKPDMDSVLVANLDKKAWFLYDNAV
jgi:A/G-specific adenine glycosylase